MPNMKRMLGSRAALTLGAWVAYALAFIPLYNLLGTPVAAAGILPVVTTGGLFGMRAGLLAGLLVFSLNMLLMTLGGAGWDVMIHGGLPGSIVIVLIGAVVGRLRDMGEQVKQELIKRKQAEEALYRAHDELEMQVQERTADLAQANEALRAEITERKQAEEALRVSEERFALAMQGSNDGLYDWDIVNNTLYWSPRLKEILGYADNELDVDFDTFETLLHPDDREHTNAAIEAHLKNRELFDVEQRLLAKSGEYVWTRARGQAVWDEEGQPIRMVGSTTDITERKRAEEALAEERNLLRTLINNLPDLIYVKDTESRYLVSNTAHMRFLGATTPEEVVGKSVFELFPQGLAEQYYADDQKVIQSGQPLLKQEERSVDEKGNSVWNLTTKVPLEDSYGKIVGIVGIARDITERKRAEDALRESEERFRLTVEATRDGLWENSFDHKRDFFSDRMFTMLGYEPMDPVHAYNFFNSLRHPDDIENHEKTLNMISKPGHDDYSVEMRLKAKDGTWRHILSRGKCVERDEKGRWVRFVGTHTDITDLKRAETEIRRLNQFLDSVINTANVWLDVIDKEGNVMLRNRAAEEISGYSREEVLGHAKIWEWLYPDEKYRNEILARAIARIGTGEEAKDVETTIRRKDGQTRVISWNSRNLVDEEGNSTGSIALGHDITERKRVEEALRESEKKYRTILENIEEGYYEVDIAGNFTFFNDSLCRLHGYPENELMGMNNRQYMDAEAAKRVYQTFNTVYRTGKPAEISNWEVIRKDKTRRFVEASVSLIRDSTGEPAGFRGIIRDITGRKRAERLLRALNEASLAMERALTQKEIFAAISRELKKLGFSCIVFLTDESQNRLLIRYVSYEARAIKVLEKLTSLKIENFSIPIETADVYRKVIWERKAAFIENVEDVIRQFLPKPLKKFTGQITRMLKITKSIPTPLVVKDEVIGLLSVESDDLTEDDIPAITAFAHQMAAAWRKAQLLQDLERRLEELKQTQAQLIQAEKLAAIGQLVAGVAHELNNPLTSVVGYSQLLMGAQCSEEIKRDLDRINRQATRAAKIVEGLLTFARRREPRKEPINLNEVVERSLDLQGHQLELDRISIVKELDETLPPTLADPFQMQQVFINIIGNAHQALRDWDGERQLRVRSKLEEDMIHLEFADSGPGIPPEVMGRLFEPFFTTREVGQGTGLGLSISYGIMETHGGRIWAKSEVGKGATFIVEIPTNRNAQ